MCFILFVTGLSTNQPVTLVFMVSPHSVSAGGLKACRAERNLFSTLTLEIDLLMKLIETVTTGGIEYSITFLQHMASCIEGREQHILFACLCQEKRRPFCWCRQGVSHCMRMKPEARFAPRSSARVVPSQLSAAEVTYGLRAEVPCRHLRRTQAAAHENEISHSLQSLLLTNPLSVQSSKGGLASISWTWSWRRSGRP